MARMLGRVRPEWCPYCRGVPGPDCPTSAATPKQVRQQERAQVRREVEAELLDDGWRRE